MTQDITYRFKVDGNLMRIPGVKETIKYLYDDTDCEATWVVQLEDGELVMHADGTCLFHERRCVDA